MQRSMRHYSNTKNDFSKRFFQSFQMTKYNNDKQTWFSDTLTSARPLDGRFRLGFQHLHPRGPVGVNASKICLVRIFILFNSVYFLHSSQKKDPIPC